ncbi:MAG: RagB/SusD family nutrient uptake outer membrane protein, partial [Pedobacter sp.]
MKILSKYILTLKIVLVTLVAAISISSCKKDYLNVEEYVYDQLNTDSVFKTADRVRQYVNGIAGYLPSEDRLWTNSWSPFQGASDENFTSWNDDRHAAMKFLLNEITPFNANNYFNNWGTWYKGINKANVVIERLDECQELSVAQKREYLGEMYFFKGYFMYLLIQQYGPAVIPQDGIPDITASNETLTLERSSYEECVNYISKNMDLAAEYLPVSRESLADVYRPTQAAALAVSSRVLLAAASPMYNGNQSYSDWKKVDGTPFISQVKDNTKWGQAAIAALKVMKTNRFELHTYPKGLDTEPLHASVPTDPYPNGAGNIDPYRSYKYTFIGEVVPTSNPEVIWCTAVSPKDGDSPLWLSTLNLVGGGNGLNVTQGLVDAYRMKDGKDINSSPLYPLPADAWVASGGSAKNYSDVQLQPNTAKMHMNRDARFYATIGFNHSYFKGTSYTGDQSIWRNVEITYYSNGNGAPPTDKPNDYNLTGYTCIKYNHHFDNMRQSGSVTPKIFPMFRYAEILLNYAEALNELDAPYTDPISGLTVSRDLDEIKKAFNRIRFRAGLPGLSATELASKEVLRDVIKAERRVEFACEGRRYHDLRRWLDARDAYNAPIIGMNVKANLSQRDR